MTITYNIIEHTEETGSQAVDYFETEKECRESFAGMIDPDNLNPYYDDLVKNGGSLRMEDSDGNEIA